jgi:hypothetical protein
MSHTNSDRRHKIAHCDEQRDPFHFLSRPARAESVLPSTGVCSYLNNRHLPLKIAHILVRAVGLEPTRRCHRGILSPLRLPVPPRPRPLFLKAFCNLVNECFADIPLCFAKQVLALSPYVDRFAEMPPCDSEIAAGAFWLVSAPALPEVRITNPRLSNGVWLNLTGQLT